MIRINKKQAMALNKQGFKFGEDISHTYGHHHSYYLVETKKALDTLSKLENIVEVRK